MPSVRFSALTLPPLMGVYPGFCIASNNNVNTADDTRATNCFIRIVECFSRNENNGVTDISSLLSVFECLIHVSYPL